MSYLNQFHYSITGPESGRKWVFLHGLMGFAGNWRRIISALEKTERCLTYDQRGHGRSYQPNSGYAPEDYAQDLAQIISELGWQKIVLVGHSMGGRNALHFASKYPEKVEKLVIVDIGPEAKPEAHQYYENLLGLVPTPFSTREAAKAYLMKDFIEKLGPHENPLALAQYFYANLEEKSDGSGVDWRFSKKGIIDSVRQGREDDRWHEVKELRMPTLLLRGEKSKDLSQEVYEKMISANNLMRGEIIKGAGHWVHSDQPEAVIESLKRFVGVL